MPVFFFNNLDILILYLISLIYYDHMHELFSFLEEDDCACLDINTQIEISMTKHSQRLKLNLIFIIFQCK